MILFLLNLTSFVIINAIAALPVAAFLSVVVYLQYKVNGRASAII